MCRRRHRRSRELRTAAPAEAILVVECVLSRDVFYRETKLRGSILAFARAKLTFSGLESVELLAGDLLKSFVRRPGDR
jgi:hypothetical protein